MRSSSGQASLDYVAIVAVAAVVLALGAAVAAQTGLADAVGATFQRALCRVTGEGCTTLDPPPCTTSSTNDTGTLGVEVALLRINRSLSVLQEQKSDGTVDVTLLDGGELGGTEAAGAEGEAHLGSTTIGAGEIEKAQLLAVGGRRRIWHLPDARAAQQLVHRIRRHFATGVAAGSVPLLGHLLHAVVHAAGYHGDELPPPDADGVSAGVKGAVEVAVGDAKLQASLAGSLGGTHDRTTGRTTFVVRVEGKAAVALGTALAGPTFTGEGIATATLTLDRSGAPSELAVELLGSAAANVGLRDGLSANFKGRVGAGGRVAVSGHLPLDVPEHRAAAEALLRAVVPGAAGPGPVAAALRVGTLIAQSGRLDAALYATATGGAGVSGEAGLGAEVGASADLSRVRSRLVTAWTRPAGGLWTPRLDCQGTAA